MQNRVAPCARARFAALMISATGIRFFPLQPGGIMRALRAVGAILAAAAGLDREQAATLHLLAPPMLQMLFPALRDEIEERLVVEALQFREIHDAFLTA